MGLLLQVLSTLILLYRLVLPRLKKQREFNRLSFNKAKGLPPTDQLETYPHLTIVVPARNEEQNLKRLLPSLLGQKYPFFEIIVANDQSTDNTVQIAEAFGVNVFQVPAKPERWSGKTWACWCASQHAKGDLILFTDADCEFYPDTLMRSVVELKKYNLNLLSATPFHVVRSKWESWLGPFHLFFIIATAAWQLPKLNRYFAIGQYLLFEKSAYDRIGGHMRVRYNLAEDLEFARIILQESGSYGVYSGERLYQVRMYGTIGEFFKGWSRIIRWGLRRSQYSIFSTLEMGVVVAGMLSSVQREYAIFYLIYLGVFAFASPKVGQFSVLGALFFPISVTVFCLLSFWASVQSLLGQFWGISQSWKGREYGSKQV